MHILLIGSGGREHALAWKLARSASVSRLSVAPGNPGTAEEPRTANVTLDPLDAGALVAFARAESVELAVVGPEAPLAAGVADALRAAGVPTVGPGADGARLESSKAFAKDFMARHGIPTAAHASFTDVDAALAFVEERGAPIVIKADGLAAGKGVTVAEDLDVARAAVREALEGSRFGEAGHRVVIEERLEGEEASFIALVDGTRALPLATSQDHKARDERDLGPNTGGMGAVSPAPVVTETVHAHVVADILRPTLAGLAADGVDFRGVLYVGLMIDRVGSAKVIEYNVRLGDPETQPLMLRLESDLGELLAACAKGALGGVEPRWSEAPAVAIVVAAGEYPAGSSRGEPIEGVSEARAAGCEVFHAGTALEGERLVTNGGRVVCTAATGEDLGAARDAALAGAERIRWPGARFRRDIGHRALDYERLGIV